jgi:hypothetical protein
MRYLVNTGTSGWYQELDGDNLLQKRTRKQDGDQIYDTEAEAKTARRVLEAVGAKPELKPDGPVTVAPTGKILIGKTTEITCQWKGCSEKRIIKPQDAFQVKYCVTHQKESRKLAQKAKRQARAADRKAQAVAA